MKLSIYKIAMFLMEKNGKTSNKEIKDVMHAANSDNPGFSLRQSEVSDVMNELFSEQSGAWLREYNTTTIPGVTFYEYSLNPSFVTVGSAQQLTTSPSDGTVVNVTAPLVINTNNPSSTSTQLITPLDKANGELVCYVSKDKSKYVQGNTKKDVKKACFNAFNTSVIGLTYDNLNICRVDYFNKHYLQ